jgi:DNA-binding NtrC family response regulator
VNEGHFRADLYYRLAEIELELPPLRERREDLEILAEQFLLSACLRLGSKVPKLTPDAVERLRRHDWPGNVRELRNLMERLAALFSGGEADADTIAQELRESGPTLTIDSRVPYKRAKAEAQRRFDAYYLADLVERCQGNLTRAAREAGIMRHHLRYLLRRHGITLR